MAKNTDTQEQLLVTPDRDAELKKLKADLSAATRALNSANADIRSLKSQLKASEDRICELGAEISELRFATRPDGVFLGGKEYAIIHGPLRADFVLDEVKKGHVHENRTAVIIDRYE